MPEIIAAFAAAGTPQAVATDTSAWSESGLVNGYWHGDAGIAVHSANELPGVIA
jgi:hypothetical protein